MKGVSQVCGAPEFLLWNSNIEFPIPKNQNGFIQNSDG